MITEDQILDFENKTNFQLLQFLVEVKLFFSINYPKINNFYSGRTQFIEKSNFKILDNLLRRSEDCTEVFSKNKNLFNRAYFWEILDSVEDIKIKLQTTKNLSKFLRSSIINSSNKSGVAIPVKMNKNETLEDVSKKILNSTDPDNDWVEIALQNDLKEENWDIDGGTNILVRKNIFQSDLVTTFIDNSIGNKIYGKDLDKEMKFENNDLKVLDHRETVYQTVEILSSISRGDIPEFRNLGIDPKVYKGSNYSQLNAASISNQLRKNFDTDDLFKDFEIIEIKLLQGDIFIEFQVNTKINEVLIQNVTI
jgi:hypothetical protein